MPWSQSISMARRATVRPLPTAFAAIVSMTICRHSAAQETKDHDACPCRVDRHRPAARHDAVLLVRRGADGVPRFGTAAGGAAGSPPSTARSEEHTSELQSLMRISYAVFCLKKQTHIQHKR